MREDGTMMRTEELSKLAQTVSNEIYNNKKFARLPKMQANIKEMLRYRLNNCH